MSRQSDLFGDNAAPEPPEDIDPEVRPLLGLEVELKNQRCICGSCNAIVTVGKGPQKVALRCAGCGGFRMWLGSAGFKFLADIVARFGRPESPIEIRPKPRATRANRGVGYISPSSAILSPPTAERRTTARRWQSIPTTSQRSQWRKP